MLFRRRNPASKAEKLRIMLWPRHSWKRSVKYMSKRILRLTGSPHAIAAGVAAGMLASFTPFLGFHFLIAFAVAFVIGGNFLAAAMGTFFGNPLTFPIIWASTHQLGSFILSGEHSPEEGGQLESLASTNVMDVGVSGFYDQVIGIWEPVIKPMLVGSIPLGITAGFIGYILTRWASVVFQKSKQKKQQLRQRRKMASAQSD